MSKTTQTPEVAATLAAAPVLTGHRLAGKVQRQRVDLAVGINVDRLMETHGPAIAATDVPSYRSMVMAVVANALDDAFGDAAVIDKYPSADAIFTNGEGANAYGYEEDVNLANVDWCKTDWRATGIEHSPDCEADHS